MGALLDAVEVASPCQAAWQDMSGDDRVRFCGLCQKSVYDLSGLSETDAEALLAREGDLCIRLFRREDGTVLTQDCPVGLAARMRRSARRRWAALGAFALSALGIGAVALSGGDDEGACSLESAPVAHAEAAPGAAPSGPPVRQAQVDPIDERRIRASRGGYFMGLRHRTIQVIKGTGEAKGSAPER